MSDIEWKNGEECIYTGQPELKCKFVAIHPNNSKCAIIWEGGGDINLSCVAIDCLLKPETPEQKAERERMEAAERLHDIAQDAYFANEGGSDGSATWDKAPNRVKNMYLAIVDETNYRKQ